MNHHAGFQPTGSSADDEFFARLALALEHESDRGAVVERFCAERRDLAREIRDLAALDGHLKPAPRSDAAPLPERLGEFRILRVIAIGGMGLVYEAEQPSLDNRKVAIKVIRRGYASPEYRARFDRERSVLARQHHTHVVPIYAAGEEDGVAYFVMPYIQGAPLNRVLDATCLETRARAGTPTLGEIAQRIAPSDSQRPGSTNPTLALGGDSREGNSAERPRAQLGDTRLSHLSTAYFRSVAEVMVEAAEAIQHAHQSGILHRDLKPANIMVDASGHCWIIDFGLAGPVAKQIEKTAAAPAIGPPGGYDFQTAARFLGTVPYLAPEQLSGQADVRSDVYGLGTTLFELCTWRLPYSPSDPNVLERIRTEPVRSLKELVANVPEDLAAICQKAVRKSPAQRYNTAQQLADDLRRWLHHEPTVARPARVPRRVWLWSRRNPGWAAALLAGCLSLAIMTAAVWVNQSAKVAASERQVAWAETIDAIQATNHQDGWSDATLDRIREFRPSPDYLVEMRSYAAGALAGLDARRQRQFDTPASVVAFDREGKRLAFGGPQAFVWDGSLHRPIPSQVQGMGPVGFSQAGQPLQLVAESDTRLALWDIEANKRLREFDLPEAAWTLRAIALAADGQWVGAAADSPDRQQGKIVVWKVANDKPARTIERRASALAFSPDGALLAAGNEDGQLHVWSLPDGATIAEGLSMDRAEIMTLAFGRDPRAVGNRAAHWLLAAGDASATTVVWDLVRKAPRSVCRGSNNHVHSVKFSPDGSLVSTVGRGDVRLWDAATGRLLLSISESNWLTDLDFSPDGKHLAVSSQPAFGDTGQVSIWKLERGRGTQALHGLGANVEKVIFSPDDQLLAAYSHDSRLAVWDLKEERLLHVFEAQKTVWHDNASAAFSPDNKRVAYAGSGSSSSEVKMWELAGGNEVGAWSVNPGLNQLLVFDSQARLLLFQVEVASGKGLPDGSRHPTQHPRVGRVYELAPGQPAKQRFEITDFRWNIEWPVAPEDGRFLVVLGTAGGPQPATRQVKAFDLATGQEKWSSSPEPLGNDSPQMMLDRSGQNLTVTGRGVLDGATGKHRTAAPKDVATLAYAWSPDLPFALDLPQIDQLGLTPQGSSQPVLLLDRERRHSGSRYQFSRDGRRLAWGTSDGAVHVCDIQQVQRRLTEMGLGW